jgi:hypothetical protein
MCERHDGTGNVHILLITNGSCFGVKTAFDGGDIAPRPSQKEAGHCASICQAFFNFCPMAFETRALGRSRHAHQGPELCKEASCDCFLAR